MELLPSTGQNAEWQVEGEQLQSRQNGSNLIYFTCTSDESGKCSPGICDWDVNSCNKQAKHWPAKHSCKYYRSLKNINLLHLRIENRMHSKTTDRFVCHSQLESLNLLAITVVQFLTDMQQWTPRLLIAFKICLAFQLPQDHKYWFPKIKCHWHYPVLSITSLKHSGYFYRKFIRKQIIECPLTDTIPLPANLMRTTSSIDSSPSNRAMILDTTVARLSLNPGLHGFTKSSSMIREPEFSKELNVLKWKQTQ